MIRINDILDKITDYNPEADLDLVRRAYVYSARVHEGQVRLSGEPYLAHPLEVAGILADMNLDVVSVAAGFLHDVIEDTHASQEEIEDVFGGSVAHIVSGVTKISSLSFQSSQERQAESIRKMILAMADDIRVILIKLADRMHNMRTLQFHSEEKQLKIAMETMDIYAPIAGRLGINWIKSELENTAFMYIQPKEHENIKNLVNIGLEDREKQVEVIKEFIIKNMNEVGLKCTIKGRHKQFYSIYQKMQNQELEFEDVYDIFAVRIILDTVNQCYEALGIIHALMKPIPKKFKDYIGIPKANMYQSLHTTVIGPSGNRIEIQIRTEKMDKVAKAGIAAHWSYKEGRVVDEKVVKSFAWIQDLVENQANVKDPDEFMENVRIDLFPGEIYVFTPNGDIKTLPKGATPVDFAYIIHTEVGNQCTGAKVNGRMVSLPHKLKTGDRVEIITSKGHTPSKDWLNFVKTVKARSRIRQWIKVQEKERSVTLGRELCEKVFRKHNLNFKTLSKSKEMNRVLKIFGVSAVEDLIANVGYGKNTPLQVVRKFLPKTEIEENKDKKDKKDKKAAVTTAKERPGEGVIVTGVGDVLVRFGKCCQPVPGDLITGYISRGHGVTIHRANCINALKMTPERKVEVEWTKKPSDVYPVKIHVRSYDRFGLLADITMSISSNNANIISAKTEIEKNNNVGCFFSITVNSTEHLQKILAAINKVKDVL